MGNEVGKLTICFTGTDIVHRRKQISGVISNDLGHSFCYVRPDPSQISSSKVHSEEPTIFRSISGASVSANTSTPLSTSFLDVYSYNVNDKASAFESSTSFASVPLQPLPKNTTIHSGPLHPGTCPGVYSGPIERGFCSGPIDREFQSGPLFSGPLFSGPLDHFQRSYSHGGLAFKRRSRKRNLIRVIRRAISRTFTTRVSKSSVAPMKNVGNWVDGSMEKQNELTISSVDLSCNGSILDDDNDDCCLKQSRNVEWAQGKAGEDRVHVVVCEENGWVFVGIYDGFNGPDAPDFLLTNLYAAVHKELKELLSHDQIDSSNSNVINVTDVIDVIESKVDDQTEKNRCEFDIEGTKRCKSRNHRRWKCEFDRERLELDRRLREDVNSNGSKTINHSDVLKALSEGLRKSEEAYLDIADQMVDENPELALMGSCVLVMLMKGEDVYVMNVGDSRAVLGQKSEPDIWRQDLEKINEETWYDLEVFDADILDTNPSLFASQLSMDHSTSIEEEVQRIKSEHPDDPCAVTNDRVKGSLKVTRAFGAGFLKKPKWNNALLEMFRIDYVGNAPYINCLPYLRHHRLCSRDRFLILSSDGLYQYFTNEEVVSEVELFIQWSPEGDPAQHLVEEVLLRAAKKAGMDFHELLEIPQGDRRRYHDDVSIIVISLEGRIWRSCV
ncbi:hypothetical protein QVD17_00625 [Tagetes erecta]|uniref:protein-serine/threonine phosphatase n=1 Tax=Tagetes erecta TaxID=13708 RepID=A0AAD8L950_TARER|nr:hypothetical protein QVD17_00625 [Tagetes erecta]